MSKRGGRRPGAGRPKGTKGQKVAARALAMQVAGIEPKTFLLNGLAFYEARIREELKKGRRADHSVIAELYREGAQIAKDVAPYCHSRLPQAIQLGNTLPDDKKDDGIFRVEFVGADHESEPLRLTGAAVV